MVREVTSFFAVELDAMNLSEVHLSTTAGHLQCTSRYKPVLVQCFSSASLVILQPVAQCSIDSMEFNKLSAESLSNGKIAKNCCLLNHFATAFRVKCSGRKQTSVNKGNEPINWLILTKGPIGERCAEILNGDLWAIYSLE